MVKEYLWGPYRVKFCKTVVYEHRHFLYTCSAVSIPPIDIVVCGFTSSLRMEHMTVSTHWQVHCLPQDWLVKGWSWRLQVVQSQGASWLFLEMLGQRLFLFLTRFESGRIPGTAGNYMIPKKLGPTSRK